jgi:hypothetical protein
LRAGRRRFKETAMVNDLVTPRPQDEMDRNAHNAVVEVEIDGIDKLSKRFAQRPDQ